MIKYINKICPIFPFLVSDSWHIFIWSSLFLKAWFLVLAWMICALCSLHQNMLSCSVMWFYLWHLELFVVFFLPYWLKFLSILRTSFLTSYKTELVEIYSLGFWLSDNVFISTKFPKNSLLGIRLLVDNFPFLLSVVKISSHSLLACRISAKKWAVRYISILFCIVSLFLLP